MARDRAREVAVKQGTGNRDWGLALIGALAATVALAHAQAPQTTFRSEINFVQIPVRVLDARGDFVRGLTQSDFHIFEDGQLQTIAAFNAVDIPFVPAAPLLAKTGPLADLDAAAPDELLYVEGRIYLFILDNQTMDPATSLRTRHVLRRFLDQGFARTGGKAIVLVTNSAICQMSSPDCPRAAQRLELPRRTQRWFRSGEYQQTR